MIRRCILLFIATIFMQCGIMAQKTLTLKAIKEYDTTVIGRVLDTDSNFYYSNTSRAGFLYYYGFFHIKVAVMDAQTDRDIDTVTIAYVYNRHSEIGLYNEKFNLKRGNSYILDICYFTPCQSDFPRLEGRCQNGQFFPVSNRLIKSYAGIYRVINIIPYKPH